MRAADEQIGGYILKTFKLGQPVLDQRRPTVELLQVGSLQGELVEALGQHAANSNDGRILQIRIDAGHGGKFAAQFLDNLIHVRAL